MAVDSRAVEVTRRESSGSYRLWFGVLGGPIAWTGQLLLNYSLEEWFACSPATTTEGVILGLSVRTLAFCITLVLATVAVLAGLVAASCLRRAPEDTVNTSERVRWMALAGVMNSVLYVLIIVASFGPPLFLDTCETTP